MTSRFLAGVGTGLGLSFSILQGTTDRRIMSIKAGNEDDRSNSIYQYRLYREMYNHSQIPAESDIEKKGKSAWNSIIRGVADGLNGLTSSIASAIGSLGGGPDKKE